MEDGFEQDQASQLASGATSPLGAESGAIVSSVEPLLSAAADGPIVPTPLLEPGFELATVAQMRAIEAAYAAQNGGMRDLMFSAGRAAAAVAAEHIGPVANVSDDILVVCGSGGNGGDGYVLAQALKREGYPVKVLAVASPTNPDTQYFAGQYEGEVQPFEAAALKKATYIVDAYMGTGCAGEISADATAVIEAVNNSNAVVLSLDLPAGVDADTGQVQGIAVQASATIVFQLRKPGHLIAPGRFYCGAQRTLSVVDIGIKPAHIKTQKLDVFENDPALWGHYYPQLGPAHHKYDRGHVLVLGGREPALGASRMAAQAAMRVGAGLVTLAAPADTYVVQAAALTDVMVRRFESNFGFVGILSGRNIGPAVVGPGAGVGANTSELIAACVENNSDLILDADALTTLAGRINAALANYTGQAVLTPHEGEFSRLFPEISWQENRLEAARQAAKYANAVVVLKGVSTIIAAPDGRAAINTNAPAWLAVGGTGDVLSGMIAGFMGQGMPAFEGACAAVWTHSLTAQRCGKGMLASDMLTTISSCLL